MRIAFMRMKRNIIILILILAAIAGVFFYVWHSYNTARNDSSGILSEVGKLIILPQDETPIIATVTDLSKLQGQAFFAQAKVGDKVLIYAKAGKAILYDPVINKVIGVAPFNMSTNQAEKTL
jgi:tellurite resistance protein TehA-like permease